MEYLLILIWICLKPWWPVFLGAALATIAGICCHVKKIYKGAIIAGVIATPLIAMSIYLVFSVLNAILNQPW